jgi:nucleolar GTP-binding protein
MSALSDAGATWITTSTLTDVGVGDLKTMACDKLLEARAEQKEGSGRFQAIQNRLYCAEPRLRDNISREAFVPDSVAAESQLPQSQQPRRKTERDLEWENGGPGQYQANHRKTWDLENQEWVDDIMPDIMDGHNVFDSVDPDICERLLELEAEEDRRIEQVEIEESRKAPEYSMDDATIEAVQFIREKIRLNKMGRAVKNTQDVRTRQQAISIERFNSRTGSTDKRPGEKRGRSVSAEDALERDRSNSSHVSTKSSRNMSRSGSGDRSLSVNRGEGFKDVNQKLRAVKLSTVQVRPRNRMNFTKQGEGDRVVNNKKPKHLYSGKVKSNGKRDRR